MHHSPSFATPTSAPFAALAHFLLSHMDQLIDAAGVLGGQPAVRRTARLLEDVSTATALNRRLSRELVGLHRLLSLQAVDEPDSLEAGCFSEIDPSSPVVEQICLLTDQFRDHLEALVDADDDGGLLSLALADAA